MAWSVERATLLERALQQRRRFVVETEAGIYTAEYGAQLRLHIGLTGEHRVDAGCTSVE